MDRRKLADCLHTNEIYGMFGATTAAGLLRLDGFAGEVIPRFYEEVRHSRVYGRQKKSIEEVGVEGLHNAVRTSLSAAVDENN